MPVSNFGSGEWVTNDTVPPACHARMPPWTRVEERKKNLKLWIKGRTEPIGGGIIALTLANCKLVFSTCSSNRCEIMNQIHDNNLAN